MAEFFTISKAMPFEITNEEERLVSGFFGDDLVDIDGHMISLEGYQKALQEYMPWGNIREMHNTPVGTVESYGELGWNYITVKISDDNAWKKVKDGVYKGFSIGARVLAKSWVDVEDVPERSFAGVPDTIKDAIIEVGKVLRIDKLALVEISLVDRPANPRALILSHKGMSDNDLDRLPVDDKIIAAQLEWYDKGDKNMSKEKDMLDEIQEDVVVEDVEKDADPDVVEKEAEEVEDVVVDEPVAEVEAEEVDEDEDEVEVEPEVEEVVEAAAESDEEDDATTYDAEAEVKNLTERMDVIEANLATMTQKLDKALEALTEKTVDADEDVVEEDVIDAEVEAEPEVEDKSADLDLKAIIEDAAEKAVAKYRASEGYDERQNIVNQGDGEEDEVEKSFEFEELSKDDKYKYFATAVADMFNR